MFPIEIWSIICKHISNEKDIINLARTNKQLQEIVKDSVTTYKYEAGSENIKLALKLPNIIEIKNDLNLTNSYQLLKLARLPKLKYAEVALWHNKFPYPCFNILDFVTLYCFPNGSKQEKTLHDANFSFRLGSNIYITIRKGIISDFENNEPDIIKLIIGMIKLNILRGIVINSTFGHKLIKNIRALNMYEHLNIKYHIPILELGIITTLKEYVPYLDYLNVKEIHGDNISLTDIDYYYDDIKFECDITKTLKILGRIFLQQFDHTKIYNTIKSIKFPLNINDLSLILPMFPNITYLGLNGDVKNLENLTNTVNNLQEKNIKIKIYTCYKYHRFSFNNVKISHVLD